MTPQEFAHQMMRLSSMFNPGMFDGETGPALRDEYFKAIGGHVNPGDLKRAVDWLIREHEGFFPRPAKIIEYIERAARQRISEEQARRLRLPEPEKTPEEEKRIKEIAQNFYRKMRGVHGHTI